MCYDSALKMSSVSSIPPTPSNQALDQLESIVHFVCQIVATDLGKHSYFAPERSSEVELPAIPRRIITHST